MTARAKKHARSALHRESGLRKKCLLFFLGLKTIKPYAILSGAIAQSKNPVAGAFIISLTLR